MAVGRGAEEAAVMLLAASVAVSLDMAALDVSLTELETAELEEDVFFGWPVHDTSSIYGSRRAAARAFFFMVMTILSRTISGSIAPARSHILKTPVARLSPL